MSESSELPGFERRRFGKLMALAGTAGVVAMTGTPARAESAAAWKDWVNSFYKKPVKIAVSCAGTSNPYFAPTKAGAEDAGAQLGIDMLWTGVPDGNTVNQIAQFGQLVNSGYEAIVVISFEPDAWIAPIKKAMAAGVLVLTSNNDTPNSGRELYFGQDLVGAAVVQGQMLAKLAGGKGKVALTNCAPGSLALDQRIQGARQGIKMGGMQDVGVYNTNPADMASELGTMKDILRAHPDLAAVMPLCGPDTAAAGLVRKMQGHKLPIIGTDLLYQTLELIRDGYIDATVGQQPYLQGYMPVMYTYQRVVLGAPKLNLPGGNYFLANEIVTKENVAQFLAREARFPGMSDEPDGPLLNAENISKSFGAVRALDRVSLTVAAGEVHGLLGANGAGKSTLIGVLSGAIRPDGGRLSVAGRAVPLGSLAGAREAGLAVVHQELMLFPDRTVEENIFASVLPGAPFRVVGRRGRRQKVEAAMGRLGARVDLRARVGDLPLPHRQLVEIARALCSGGTVLVLDEPTSSLSQPEAQGLFEAIRGIVAREAAVIFVSHRLDEVFAITDRLTVLRDGRVEGRWRTADADIPVITRAMVGQLADERPRPADRVQRGGVALHLRGSAPGLEELDLSLGVGEVVGLAGLEGSGVATAMQMLGGIMPVTGRIEVGGRAVAFRHPSQAIGEGIVYMPPDRKKSGLWLERDAGANIGAARVTRMRPFRWLRRRTLDSAAAGRMAEVGVRSTALHEAVGRLSGGNQQRVLLGKSLEAGPRVLLLNDFTRGVDVKAKAAIHRLVRGLADAGIAICVTSADLEELLDVADRIVCMRAGRVVADQPSAAFDKLSLLALASTADPGVG